MEHSIDAHYMEKYAGSNIILMILQNDYCDIWLQKSQDFLHMRKQYNPGLF